MSVLNRPYFRAEEAAFSFLESILWPDGSVCPHCGVIGTAYKIAANPARRVRYGLWKCKDCRRQFTVKVGTVFEHARLPLHKALQAAYLLCSSKKGVSAHQLSRTLEISLKAAWFLAHRVREAMKIGDLPLMGEASPVQVDETYFGTKDDYRGKSKRQKKGLSKKMAVVALVTPGGSARAFHVDYADAWAVRQVVAKNVAKGSTIHTDESTLYKGMDRYGIKREAVNHSHGVYVRRDGVTTNAVENFFSVFKRGMRGVYQHCSEKHLHRYLAEFDFRYSNRQGLGVDDSARTMTALLGVKGKRLTYLQAPNIAKGGD